jgi:hypothetical protein
MAYRVNARFKDGSTNGPLADIVAAKPPRYGETISLSKRGHAIWTPCLKQPSSSEPLIVVEACEA